MFKNHVPAGHAGQAPDVATSNGRKLFALLLSVPLLVAPLWLTSGSGVASAAPLVAATCGVSPGAPATLPAGIYGSITVNGQCDVDGGQVVVTGDVTVTSGASLIASYARNGGIPGTTSGITVNGSITVATGGSLVLGCKASSFQCTDDSGNPSTLDSPASVGGGIVATSPIGVVVHNSTIGGDVTQSGGGGGVDCSPGSLPVFGIGIYSDYEDNTIGGSLHVTDLASCWLGVVRNTIAGSAVFMRNTLSDPDASEILSGHIAGNLLCIGNSPVVHFGDSGGRSNVVSGYATGECAASQPNPASGGPMTPISVPSPTPNGYWLVAQDGGVFSFGVPFLGSGASTGQVLSQPVAALASQPGGTGYSLASASGQVNGHGNQTNSCLSVPTSLNKPTVGLATAPGGGGGCWLVASDGGVFASGSTAPFYGSAGALTLNQSVVGIAAAPNGDGYYLVAADGGIFAYGPGAIFQGSMGGQHLNQPIVGIAVDPATGGYWLIAKDGGIFAFNAPFVGSLGAIHLNQPIVGGVGTAAGNGYYMVASDGGVFTFGPSATFRGSMGGTPLNQPIVGMAVAPSPSPA